MQKLFLKTHAVSQMLNYIYRIERKKVISKSSIYSGFFNAPFVKMYCDQSGIDIATEEGAKHRCPFLVNVLEAMGVLQQDRSEVTIQKFLVSKQTMQLQSKESEGDIVNRIKLISDFVNKKIKTLPSEEESLLKETYGKEFMTDKYFINEYEILNNGSEKDVK